MASQAKTEEITENDLTLQDDKAMDLSRYTLQYEFTDEVPTETFGQKQQKLASLAGNLVILRNRITLECAKRNPEEFNAMVLAVREQAGFAKVQLVNLEAALNHNYPKFGLGRKLLFILKAIFNRSYTQLTTLRTLNNESERANMEQVVGALRSSINQTVECVNEMVNQAQRTIEEEARQKRQNAEAANARAREIEQATAKREREARELQEKEDARKRNAKIKEALRDNVAYQALVDALADARSGKEIAAGINWDQEWRSYPNRLTNIWEKHANALPKIVSYGDVPKKLIEYFSIRTKEIEAQMKDVEEGVVIHLDLDTHKEKQEE